VSPLVILTPDWQRLGRWVVGLWLASRIVVGAAGVLLTTQLGWHRALAPWQRQPWKALTGWDTVYYVDVSHHGYSHGLSVAFFPLYPMLMWGWREVTGTGDVIAAMGVSNLAVLIGMAGLYVLARDRLSERHARRAVLYLVLSPYAFCLVMAYSEGVFLATATWLFVLSDRGRDRWAIPLAFASGLTRPTGAALVLPLALRAYRRRTVSAWLVAVAPAAALAAHAAWLWHAVGDPLAMVHVQSRWGGHATFPLVPLADQFWRFATTHDVFYLARGLAVIAYLALLIPILRSPWFARTRWEDTLYVAGIFALPLFSGVLFSVGRFGLVAFPLAFAMADLGLRRASVHRAYVAFAPSIQFLLFASSALGYRPP
jgi:Mannosyltransferase (PIG-V)